MLDFFKKEKEPKNLKELLSQFRDLKKKVDKNSKSIEDLEDNIQLTIQKIGITRFSPFKETGGDQSFAVALLDKKDNGLLLTSIYSRERNRIFAKPVEEGKSQYKLLEEEKEAIEKAKRFEFNKNEER